MTIPGYKKELKKQSNKVEKKKEVKKRESSKVIPELLYLDKIYHVNNMELFDSLPSIEL